MKFLSCLLLLSALLALGGCTLDTPAYPAKERFAQIRRNMYFDTLQANDDFDHALMLRPGDPMTIWDPYHRE